MSRYHGIPSVLQVTVVLAILVASALARTAEYQHAIEKRGISGYGGGEWVSAGDDEGGHEEQEVKIIKIPVPKAVPVPVQHPVPVPVPQPYPVHIKVRPQVSKHNTAAILFLTQLKGLGGT
jgi:hypothetical protein